MNDSAEDAIPACLTRPRMSGVAVEDIPAGAVVDIYVDPQTGWTIARRHDTGEAAGESG